MLTNVMLIKIHVYVFKSAKISKNMRFWYQNCKKSFGSSSTMEKESSI